MSSPVNPLAVTLGNVGSGGPYINTAPSLGAESVLATGNQQGYDPQYAQNLAVYGAGQFYRPGGSVAFNPFNVGSSFGNPVGGGNAPTYGMPTTLLGQAMGGQPFAPQTPTQQTAQAPTSSPASGYNWNWLPSWLQQYLQSGNMSGGGQGGGSPFSGGGGSDPYSLGPVQAY